MLAVAGRTLARYAAELKQFAASKGLLLMGPGAGTSLIGGKAIAFANVIRPGKIGLVAAAGTGLQEVSVLLSEAGLGISAGLGTGGGDVTAKIGGLIFSSF
jgi:FdrA protein